MITYIFLRLYIATCYLTLPLYPMKLLISIVQVRTDAYRSALINNPSLLNQATVLDVGCGTGILRYLVTYCILSFIYYSLGHM